MAKITEKSTVTRTIRSLKRNGLEILLKTETVLSSEIMLTCEKYQKNIKIFILAMR